MSEFKHIGIVGVTAVGTALCYKEIVVQGIKKFGHAPEISIHAHSQNEYLVDEFDKLTSLLLQSIDKVKKSGAEFAIVPANTVHYVFDEVQAASPLPLISIIDITIKECLNRNLNKVTVLGTFPTMQFSLYRDKLRNAGIQLVEPNQVEKETIDTIISDHLLIEHKNEEVTQSVLEIIDRLKKEGSQAVILACTELPIIISDQNSALPCIDTTRLLAVEALSYAFNGETESTMQESPIPVINQTNNDSLTEEPESPLMNLNKTESTEDAALEAISKCKKLLSEEKHKEAKSIMEETVKLYPNSADVHVWLAIAVGRMIENSSVLHKMRLLPIFEREIQKALHISPDLLLARKVNGMRFLNTPEGFGGSLKKAIAEFQYCLDNGLEDDEIYFSLGKAYIKLKEIEQGKQALHSSLDLNPDHKLAKKHLEMLEIQ